MKNILSMSAVDIAAAIKAKQISSEEVVSVYIAQIKKVNPSINALVQFDENQALKEAKLKDSNIDASGNLPLYGVPVTIKDNVDIFGFDNRYGSHLFDDYVPTDEATCVKRLRQAGAIILGLTNTPELTTAFETDNLIYGRTNHPLDASLSPGGSSGGEAAILAANGSLVGIGGDGGGSIRVPAHFCGISGIKPTQGLVPMTGVAMKGFGAGCLQGFGIL